MLVISIGLGIFLRYLFNIQFGGFTRTYAQFSLQRTGSRSARSTWCPAT